MAVNPVVKSRLEAQGFCGLDDETLDKLAPWMRWTYTLGTLFTLIGVALMSPAVVWTLAVITSVGIFLPFHPFDLLYNYCARFLTGTGPFPRSGPQRRFVFLVATVWLAATGWAFAIGADALGVALGSALILVGALASTTNFCIPSYIYNSVAGRRARPAAQGDRHGG